MNLYLALGGGPPSFTPGFPCLALLGKGPGGRAVFGYGTFTLYGAPFQELRLTACFVTPCQPVH